MPEDCTVGNAVLIFRKPEGNEIRKEFKNLFLRGKRSSSAYAAHWYCGNRKNIL